VKCATITPNAQRVEEFGLKKMWPSPNGTIRAILDGTVFRTAILTSRIKPYVRTWKKPSRWPATLCRHLQGGGVPRARSRPGELLFTPADGGPVVRQTIYDFECPGVLQGMHNKDSSIISFAKACFEYALSASRISGSPQGHHLQSV
jgi:isocitrate dehydrogenase